MSSSVTSNPVTSPSAAQTPPTSTEASQENSFITFEDFAKVELRLAKVLEAQRVPKSDKLLQLKVEAGDAEPRQILAGIGKTYAPEELIGKHVVIVANLAPRKMMGLMSQGMVLAASDDEGLSVLGVDKDIRAGSQVK